jgi:DNA-binding CsgD family transcriptional regulator
VASVSTITSMDGEHGGADPQDCAEPRLVTFLRMLAEAPDAHSVARAVACALLAPYDAEVVVIWQSNPDRTSLGIIGQWGLSAEVERLYTNVPLTVRHPARDVFVSGAERFLPVVEAADEYPLTSPAVTTQFGGAHGEMGVLPLAHRGIPIGVITARFSTPPERTWTFRATLDGMVSAVTLWSLSQLPRSGTIGTIGRPASITGRQREVLSLARAGHTNADIARRLGFSEKTIKADLTTLYRLLGAHGRPDLIARAERAAL